MNNGDRQTRATAAERKARTLRVVVAAAAMLALTAALTLFKVPLPSLLLMAGVVALTSIWGLPAGIAGGAVMLLHALIAFSAEQRLFRYTRVGLQRVGVVLIGAALAVAFVARLRRQRDEAARKQPDRGRGGAREAAPTTDDLTGIHNRFALRRDYGRFENRDVHVMMLDLDDFKGINDRYGRSVGDFILKKLGAALAESFGGEWCYRYGGDEFLVVLPDAPEGEFLGKLEALKRRVREIALDGQALPVHFSAGYVHGVCELSYDLRLMMHQADSNLYDAKGLGKDCCVGRAFSRVFAETLPEEADGFGEK